MHRHLRKGLTYARVCWFYGTMHLLSLDIKNFRIIKEAHIDFPDAVVGIIGPNGAGKSSIIEAIAWALYGNVATRSGKDEVKSTFARTSDNTEVGLSFVIRDQAYRIVRRLIGKSQRPEVELYRGDESESVGSMETGKHVANLLGLDWRGFLTSFLARQQELNALSDLQPARRREHLAGMLGIERLDKAMTRIREDTKLSHEKAEFLRRQLAEKSQVESRLGELREHIAKLQKEHELQAGAYAKAREETEALTSRFQRAQEEKATCSRLSARVDAEQRTAAVLNDQLRELVREHRMLDEYQREASGLDKDLVDYKSLKSEMEQLRQQRTGTESKKQLLTRLQQIQKEVRETESLTADLIGKMTNLKKRLAAIPENIEQERREAESSLEAARDEYSREKARRETIARDLAGLQKQISDIKKIGPDAVCERCRRPYGSDLPEIKEHLTTEMNEMTSAGERADQRLAEVQQRGERARETFKSLAEQATARYELIVQEKALKKEDGQLQARSKSLHDQSVEVQQGLDEIGEVTFDPQRFKEVTQMLAELEKKQQRRSQLEGSLGRLPQVVRATEDTRSKITAVETQTVSLREQIEKLGFDEAAFDKLTAKYNSAQQELEVLKTAVVESRKEHDVLSKEQQMRQDQLAGFGRAEAELEKCVDGQYYGEKLGRLFGDFRKYMIARIRPQLAEFSGTLFTEMTDGRYSLVELDEEYNIQIMDYGQYFGIDRFSGGEKDLANLCLRLAISLALTESAGLDRSFVILDEVFASQDESRRELIFAGLANLKKRFPQILLITHIEEIKHRVEALIEVRATSAGWSEVKVNGNVA